MEIADDLSVARVGVNQRLQTKRGSPGNERNVDWLVFDVQGSLFPDPDRDNYGSLVGLVDYDFRWHLGDRLTLLSDGFFDFFTDGLRTYTAGALVSRPGRGNVYVGYRGVVGPFRSDIMLANLDYRMSRKWILSASGSYDFGPTGNIGQTASVTRIGESVLIKVGVLSDTSRDNVTAVFSIEPRFFPKGRLGRLGGVRVPATGVEGLE